MDFKQSLSDILDNLHIGYRAALKDVEIVQHAAIDVGQGKKRDGEIGFRWRSTSRHESVTLELKLAWREHDTLGFARGAGGIDDGGELARQNVAARLR